MIPRAVTTAGPVWESELVERARLTGRLRITQRAVHPAQVQRALQERAAQAVVVGAEIPWLSSELIGAWRNMGAAVVGIGDPYNSSNIRLLEDWGCDLVLEEPDPEWAAAGLRLTSPTRQAGLRTPKDSKVVAVGGPRGAPGRTEVALGLAWMAARTGSCLLIEADTSPALGLRLGLPPPAHPYEPTTAHGMDVLLWSAGGSSVGMMNSGWSRFSDYQTTVVDLGPGHSWFEQWPGEKVVVCHSSPSGIVRAASFLTKMGAGQPPWVVINHLEADESVRRQVLLHMGAWAGRPPDALIGHLDDLEWGKPPPPSLRNALSPLMTRLQQTGRESLGGLVASQHAQVAHGNQVRVEHFRQAIGPRRVHQIDKEAIAPRFSGGTGLYPGEVGAPGG